MIEKPKKIVSKGKYISRWVDKSVQAFIGSVFCLIGIFVASLCLALSATNYVQHRELNDIVSPPIVGGIFFALFFHCGRGILREAQKVDPGVPLTRANTAHLPADESLVRASELPILPQQAVLLRPATDTQDSHEEQLLRPSVGE